VEEEVLRSVAHVAAQLERGCLSHQLVEIALAGCPGVLKSIALVVGVLA
jgi:hypothetical protein